jgi:hypothetical protein
MLYFYGGDCCKIKFYRTMPDTIKQQIELDGSTVRNIERKLYNGLIK